MGVAEKFDQAIAGQFVIGFSHGLDVKAMGRAAEAGDLPACLGPQEGFIIGYSAEGERQIPHTFEGILHEHPRFGWTLKHFAYGGRALVTDRDVAEIEAWLDRTQPAGWRGKHDGYGNPLFSAVRAEDDGLLRGERLGLALAECQASADRDY
jgi:hypothetical protein